MSFAIFRTRCQPYTTAHDWAVKTFLFWAAKKEGDYTFGARHLVLAVVDRLLAPVVKDEDLNEYPRFLAALNPLNEWQTSYIAHFQRCTLPQDGCSQTIITQVPAFVYLSAGMNDDMTKVDEKKLHKDTIRSLKKRLPLEKENIWYFPCFDTEDWQDIEKIWWAIKHEELPRMRVLVSHHPDYQYVAEARVMGAYAAGLFALAGLGTHFMSGQQIIPPRIDASLQKIKKGHAFETCRQALANPKHRFNDSRRFDFVMASALEDILVEKFKNIFPDDDHQQWLTFLPPDPASVALHDFLANVVTMAQGRLQEDVFQKSFGGIADEVVRRDLFPTATRAWQILRIIIENVRKFDLNGVLPEAREWIEQFERLDQNGK